MYPVKNENDFTSKFNDTWRKYSKSSFVYDGDPELNLLLQEYNHIFPKNNYDVIAKNMFNI